MLAHKLASRGSRGASSVRAPRPVEHPACCARILLRGRWHWLPFAAPSPSVLACSLHSHLHNARTVPWSRAWPICQERRGQSVKSVVASVAMSLQESLPDNLLADALVVLFGGIQLD